MCGLAGIVDLCGAREPDRVAVRRMTAALTHRGPDEDGWLFATAIGIGHRRLQIVGLVDGRQPIFNEDRTIAVVFNGELFDHPEKRAALEAKGHVYRTHTDTETIVHLYEEHGEDLFEHLRGQFAFALIDLRKKILFLARDRVGICPLHWSRQHDLLYFGSEISALLASGGVPAICDLKGLDHVLSFTGMGARRTMFANVQSVLPGHYLKIELGRSGKPGEIIERRYWDLDFPDDGDEEDPEEPLNLLDEFDATFRRAVEIRLRADVPVVGYLSGGVDSASVMAAATLSRGNAVPSFTIRIPDGKLDETSNAMLAARCIGARSTTVTCDAQLISDVYPRLVAAANAPVIDTSCAALWCLSREVRNQGYKVALTGEGADEGLAGYPWFKFDALRRRFNLGVLTLGDGAIRGVRKLVAPQIAKEGRLVSLLARVHPKWKLRGLNHDKYLLRQVSARYLPAEIPHARSICSLRHSPAFAAVAARLGLEHEEGLSPILGRFRRLSPFSSRLEIAGLAHSAWINSGGRTTRITCNAVHYPGLARAIERVAYAQEDGARATAHRPLVTA